MNKISIVLPAYNEEGNIVKIIDELQKILLSLEYDYEIIFSNDGSSDSTASILHDIAATTPKIYFIDLSRNFGHQSALKAGIDYSTGDCVISMDCDLQHPVSMLPTMIKKWEEGYEIVYSLRNEAPNTSFFKKKTSSLFYKIFSYLTDIEIEKGAADFRLIDRKVADTLKNLQEVDIFFRGIVKWVGFKQYALEYEAENRFSGQSKYTLKKMLKFASQGITSFSVKPLYLAASLGIFFTFISLFYFPYIFYMLYKGNTVSGWVSVISVVLFFGGVQLITVGIIGVYVGKIFMQVKGRPNYIVSKTNLK